MRRSPRTLRLLPLLAAASFACNQDGPTRPAGALDRQSPAFAISDAAHGGGNPHFYFLPPLVPPPAFSGAFDATAEPVVDVCAVSGDGCAGSAIVSFAMTTGSGSERIRVDTEDELYIVNWHTKSVSGGVYRISVKVATTVLGYVDVSLGRGAKGRGGTTADDVVARNGGTIPIKFRIEEGALRPVKPVWKFTILGAVSKPTADYLGGFDAAARFMRAQIDTLNSRFNTPKVFAGEFRFSLDSIYEYTGTGWTEVTAPHSGFDYKYIVDGYQGPGGWFGDYEVVFLSWPISQITTPGATDAIVHEFGHARGAIDLYGIKADGQFNPVNGASYKAPRSIMEYPYGETMWDQHSINIINRTANVVHSPPSYITEAFPSSIGIVVTDATGIPQANARVLLYPVPWFQNRVVPTPRYEVYTNDQGEYVFPANPYQPGTPNVPWLMTFPNYLVTATAGGLSGYGWMPIIDVQNVWFADRAAPYRLRITVGPTL